MPGKKSKISKQQLAQYSVGSMEKPGPSSEAIILLSHRRQEIRHAAANVSRAISESALAETGPTKRTTIVRKPEVVTPVAALPEEVPVLAVEAIVSEPQEQVQPVIQAEQSVAEVVQLDEARAKRLMTDDAHRLIDEAHDPETQITATVVESEFQQPIPDQIALDTPGVVEARTEVAAAIRLAEAARLEETVSAETEALRKFMQDHREQVRPAA